MLKRIGLVRPIEGMTDEQLRDHWLNTHGPIALRIPGLRGYRLNFVDSWDTPTAQDWAGFAELWFDDEASMREGFAALKDEIEADRLRFIGEISVCTVTEHVLR